MSASPVQSSFFCRGEDSEEKVDCLHSAKIATFAIGVILLGASILTLSGAFGYLDGEIGWTLAALGIVGLAISCVRCANQDDNTFSQRSHSNPFSVSHAGNSSYSSFKQKNTQSRNPHLKQAETYFEQGDLAAALKEIKKIYGENEITEPFIARLAGAYATSGNKEQAFKTIKEIIHNNAIKETFCAELAQAYLTEGDKEQAFKIIKEIIHNSEIKEAFLAKLAQAYLTEGNKEQAFKVIKEIIHNSQIKETFIAKLAQAYLTENDEDQAFKTIKELIHNHEIKEAFLAKLAHAYFIEGNKEEAFKTIKEIVHDRETKEAFFAKLAQVYFNEKNESGVLQIIEGVVTESLIHKLLESGYQDKYFEIMKRTIGNGKMKDFFAQVTQECYSEVKGHFEQDKSAIAITHSKNKAASSSYVQEFLKL